MPFRLKKGNLLPKEMYAYFCGLPIGLKFTIQTTFTSSKLIQLTLATAKGSVKLQRNGYFCDSFISRALFWSCVDNYKLS